MVRWFGLNQAYRTKGIEHVVDLVNKRGEAQLHKKLELDKTKDFAAAVDRLVDCESQGDLQNINAIINSTECQDLLIQYHDLMELAHRATRACQRVCQSSYNDNTQFS